MILVCGEFAFDLGKLNEYRPDGKDIYIKFDPATHKPETVATKDFGTFVRAEDNGVIYFSDIAFKMLADLAIKAGLDNMRYIAAEAGRADKRDENGDYILKRPSTKRPLGAMLAQHQVRNVLMPDDSKIVPHNLKALAEYDMISMMYARARFYGGDYANACLDVMEYISKYIFTGKATKSLMHLHKAVTELFCTFSVSEFADFADGLYARMDKIPEAKYVYGVVTADKGKKQAEGTFGTEIAGGAPVIPEMAQEPESADQGETEKHIDAIFSHEIRRVKGSDITGLDETYAAGYCEAFYDKELENADSEGFLKKLIIARTNEGAAPIDLLAEAITREHAQDNEGDILRQQMGSIRANIFDALGGEPTGLPDIESKSRSEFVPVTNDEAPETEAPETEAPETEAPETEAPETEAPETEAPETEAPETEAPETDIDYDSDYDDGILGDADYFDDEVPDEREPDEEAPDDT